MIHTVKGFGIVNKAEIDVFLELFCFFNDPADVGNLISGSSAFSKIGLNCMEIQPVHPKGDQSWVFTETPIFGHLIRRADSFEKTLMLGKIEGEGKGTTEDEMVEWHGRLDGREFE